MIVSGYDKGIGEIDGSPPRVLKVGERRLTPPDFRA